jgi:hypothetical protein
LLDSSLIDRIGLHQGGREPITVQKAEKAYGALSLYHKLDAVAKLSTKHSDIQQVFQADRDWVRTILMKK